jgi:hypothetical protein
MTFSADFGGHQGQDLNAQIDEIRTRPVRPQPSRIDRTLTFDGQQWDVSNLVTSSNPIFSASLYPKILADGCEDNILMRKLTGRTHRTLLSLLGRRNRPLQLV